MNREYKYFAFISYSRKDSREARWFQRRLEWFRFPIKQVLPENRPRSRRYVRRIYRDKTDLEVTQESYWEKIREALDQSRYLIVLCSPDSAISKPVDMEVRRFLKNHPINNVIPLIVRGNVDSGDQFNCLCPVLRNFGESLTARNLPSMISDDGGDKKEGWEEAFVGLVSYLLHLEKKAVGDHLRREERRKARRERILACAFGGLAVLAFAGGALAWHQRNRAERMALQEKATRKEAVHHLAMAHIDRARSSSRSGEILQAAQAAQDAFEIEDHPATCMATWEYLAALPMETAGFSLQGSHRGTCCLMKDGRVATVDERGISLFDATGTRSAFWALAGKELVGLADDDAEGLWALSLDGILLHANADGVVSEIARIDEKGASLSKSGERLLIGTAQGKAYITECSNPSDLEPMPLPENLSSSIFTVLSEDGSVAFLAHNAAEQDGCIMAVRYDDAHILWRCQVRRPGRLCLSPDGRLVSWYSMEGDILIADTEDGHAVQKTRVNGTLMGWMNFSPDGRSLTYAYCPPGRDTGFVEILDVAGGGVRRVYEGTEVLATALFVGRDEIFCSGFKAGVRLVRPEFRTAKIADDVIWKIYLDQGGVELFCAGRPPWLDCFSGELNKRRQIRGMGIPFEMWPFVNPKGGIVRVTRQMDIAETRELSRGTCSDRLDEGEQIWGDESGKLFWLKNGKTKMVRDFGDTVRFLQVFSNRLVAYALKEVGSENGLVHLSEDGDIEVVYSGEKELRMLTAAAEGVGESCIYLGLGAWMDRSNSGLVRTVHRDGTMGAEMELSSAGTIHALAVWPDGTRMAAALASGEVALFSLPDLTLLRRIPVSLEAICSVAPVPGEPSLLLAGDSAGSVHLVEADTGKVIYHTAANGSRVTAMALEKDRWWLAFENRLECWRHVLDADALQAYAAKVRMYSPARLQQMAVRAEQEGKPTQAIRFYKAYADSQPGDITALTEVVRLLRKTGQTKEALETLDRIIEIGSQQMQDLGVGLSFMYYELQKGLILYEQWQKDGAAEMLNRAVEIGLGCFLQIPDEVSVHLSLFKAMLADGRFAECLQGCHVLLTLLDSPNHPLAKTQPDLVKVGIICAEETGQDTSSLMSQLPLSEPFREVWLGRRTEPDGNVPDKEAGRLFYLLGRRAEHRSQIQDARKYFKKGSQAGDWHGRNQKALEQLDDPCCSTKNITDLNVRIYSLCLDLFESIYGTDSDAQKQAAANQYKKWKELLGSNPDHPLLQQGLTLITALSASQLSFLAWVQQLNGQFSESLNSAEKSVKLIPITEPSPVAMNLAHAYLFNDRYEEAVAIYQKYLGQAFENSDVKWNDELRNDFKLLREAGHDHPDMKKIEAMLNASE